MTSIKPEIEICLSPELLHLFHLESKIVVVVDILRATSCMVTAIAHNVAGIIPVATLDECAAYKAQGYLTAAERDGKKVDGFDLDNSPFSYQDKTLEGREIVVTTTNGTLAITKSAKASSILIGSFLNIAKIVSYLQTQSNPVLVVCAGWKGNVSREDMLFGGALAHYLKATHTIQQDAVHIAIDLFEANMHQLTDYLKDCQHVRRLEKLNIKKDINFCLTENIYPILPVYQHGIIRKLEF